MNKQRRWRSSGLAAFFSELLEIPALLSAATMDGDSYAWVAGEEPRDVRLPAPAAAQRSVEKLASMPATRTV